MEIKHTEVSKAGAIKITAEDIENNKTMGRIFLYFIHNNLHEEPYALLEDLYVETEYRQQGLGSKLIKEAVDVAKKEGCYKIIGTSRYARKEVHRFYQKLGFDDYGVEFRMNLKSIE